MKNVNRTQFHSNGHARNSRPLRLCAADFLASGQSRNRLARCPRHPMNIKERRGLPLTTDNYLLEVKGCSRDFTSGRKLRLVKAAQAAVSTVWIDRAGRSMLRQLDFKRYNYKQIRRFQTRLLDWFFKHKRDLPWRKFGKEKANPYHIFVVEVMLQQTQIKTVLPYYKRWLETFPTVESLAKAPIDGVLKLWEGLGYYSRAQNLHKAAQIIVNKFGGKIPDDPEILQSLPGIGRYTAGAISSIAFQKPAALVDGNVARVLSRIFNIKKDISEPKTQNYFYEIANQLVPEKEPGSFNQALMELGSLVCAPEMPRCHLCPIDTDCNAFKLGTQDELPIRKNKAKPKKIEMVVGIIKKDDRLLVRRRALKGIWGGLWEIPGTIRIKTETREEMLKKEFKDSLALHIEIVGKLPVVEHHFTHRHAFIFPFLCVTSKSKKCRGKNVRWATQNYLNQLSFPVPHQKILKMIAG